MEGEEQGGRWPCRLTAVLLTAAVFAASLWMNTRHNTFPYGYHPDEPTKVEQILSSDGDRNFRHPELMLELAQRALDWSHTRHEMQAADELGRCVSATFGAIAVAAFCVTGYLAAGLWGALLFGVAALFCSPLVVYAHYFKEDASLAMGLALVLLATRCVMSAKSRAGAATAVIFTGLACAVAVSTKYVGALFLLAGLVAVIAAPAQKRRYRFTRAIVLLVTFAFFTALINYRAFISPSDFRDGFEFEAGHVVTDHFGLTMNRPNSYFLDNLPREAGWPIVLLGAAAIPILLLTWRRRTGWDLLALLIGPGFLLALSFSIIPFTRYLLPVVLMVHIMAALAGLWIAREMKSPFAKISVGIIFLMLITAIGLPRCASAIHQFGDDSRDRLRAWLIANLPPGTVVAGDFYTGMVVHADQMRGDDVIGNNIQVHERFAASNFGPLHTLYARGYSYLAVTDAAYERYFVPQVYPIPDFQRQFNSRRQWYLDLFAHYKPVWQYDPELNLHAFTNPAIRVYKLESP